MTSIYLWFIAFFWLFVPEVVRAQYTKIEQQIGETNFELVKTTQGFYHDEELMAMVQEVGQSLEKHLDKSYDFKYYLIDVSTPNAFATTGGYVFVTRGLLTLINSRDELAGILGHEMSHITQRHSIRQLRAGVLPAIMELPANLIGMLSFKEVADIINLPISATSKIAISAFGRRHEREADRLGVKLAEKAGYDPSALMTVLQRMNDYITLMAGQAPRKSIFNDHPMTEARVVYLTDLLEKAGTPPSPATAGTNLQALDGLAFAQNPASGVVNGSTFVHPGLDLYCKFPDQWTVENSPVSVVAVDPAKRSTMVISIDSSAQEVEQAARQSLAALGQGTVQQEEATNINGLPAYRATVRYTKGKHSGQTSELMWMKLPASDVLLKIVGISEDQLHDQAIRQSLESFRMLVDDDLRDIPYINLALRRIEPDTSVKAYIDRSEDLAQQRQLLHILNDTQPDDRMPADQYFKVLQVSSLANLGSARQSGNE